MRQGGILKLQDAELDRWRQYESEKAQWIDMHPQATAKEYEQAIKKLAEEFGV